MLSLSLGQYFLPANLENYKGNILLWKESCAFTTSFTAVVFVLSAALF